MSREEHPTCGADRVHSVYYKESADGPPDLFFNGEYKGYVRFVWTILGEKTFEQKIEMCRRCQKNPLRKCDFSSSNDQSREPQSD